MWDGKRMNGKPFDSAIHTVRGGYSTFYDPLDRVADIVRDAAMRKTTLIRTIVRESAKWTDAMRDTFLLVAAYTGTWDLKYASWRVGKRGDTYRRSLVELCAGIPATDSTVRRRLGQWGLKSGGAGSVPPKKLPTTLAGALALAADLGVPMAKPAKKTSKKIPASLRAFYAKHERLGDRAIVRPAKLAGLSRSLAREIEEHRSEDEGEVDRDRIHASRLRKPFPFGTDHGGDVFLIDPAFGKAILRFVHDEAMTVAVEASSIAAFVALMILKSAFGAGLHSDEVERLAARDRARVRSKRFAHKRLS